MPTYTDRLRVQYVPGGAGGTITSYNITANESGTIFVTSGNNAHCFFNLPAAAAGLEYDFHVGAVPFAVNPSGCGPITVTAGVGDVIWWPFYDVGANYVTTTGWWWNVRLRAVDNTGWYTTRNEWTVTPGW